MSGKETVQPELEFVAYVGIDWADQKHVWCLQAAGSTERESGELEHRSETVEAWVGERRVVTPLPTQALRKRKQADLLVVSDC